MSDIDNIVSVNISKATPSVPLISFGIGAIIGEFLKTKTTSQFDRFQIYTSPALMLADGWTTYDREYQACVEYFEQGNPNANPPVPSPAQFFVGRKALESGGETWAQAMAAIQLASNNWYGFTIIPTKKALITLSTDFIASNVIAITINGVAISPVTFTTNHATTMAEIVSAIHSANADLTASATGDVLSIVSANGTIPANIIVGVTLGSSQPTWVVSLDQTPVIQAYKDVANWVEPATGAKQNKIFVITDNEAHVLTADTDDLQTFLGAVSITDPNGYVRIGYDRTVLLYSPNAMSNITPDYSEIGWVGTVLPVNPGSATWAYKTIGGVTPVLLTPTQELQALSKNANIFVTRGGVNITEEGTVASGEYIDIIQGIDYISSQLQTSIFTLLTTLAKIPFTDEGVLLIVNAIKGVLKAAAGIGYNIIVESSISVSAPLVSAVSPTNKQNRLLPNVTFKATLQGAIHKTAISGVVSI